MKIAFPFTLSTILILSFTSCEQILDNRNEQESQQNYTSPYQGKWTGAYSGNEAGKLVVEIQKSGTVQVQRISDGEANNETFFGTVNNYGAFQSTRSNGSGFELQGNLNTQTGNPSGTWRKNGTSGTWTLKKQ
jgi:hypothetical protein